MNKGYAISAWFEIEGLLFSVDANGTPTWHSGTTEKDPVLIFPNKETTSLVLKRVRHMGYNITHDEPREMTDLEVIENDPKYGLYTRPVTHADYVVLGLKVTLAEPDASDEEDFKRMYSKLYPIWHRPQEEVPAWLLDRFNERSCHETGILATQLVLKRDPETACHQFYSRMKDDIEVGVDLVREILGHLEKPSPDFSNED